MRKTEHLNNWNDILCSWRGQFHIIEMSVLLLEIQHALNNYNMFFWVRRVSNKVDVKKS